MHDRRDGVEEGERILAGELLDRFGERLRGQRSGRDDDAVPILGRQARDFGAFHGDQRLGEHGGLDGGRESVAIDRERAAGGHLIRVGRAHDERA